MGLAASADVIDAGQVCEPKVTKTGMRGVARKWTFRVESSAATMARQCRRIRARRARLLAGIPGRVGDIVEPPFAAPSEVASDRDVLLATKLHVPRPRRTWYRARLAERFDEGLARGLMLVCAPAGYGKTLLLADWARRGQPPVAWLSLDVGDNDPARFWRHGVAALDQVRPGLAERVGPPMAALLTRLIAAQRADAPGVPLGCLGPAPARL